MKIIFIIFALFVADYTSSAQDCEKHFLANWSKRIIGKKTNLSG